MEGIICLANYPVLVNLTTVTLVDLLLNYVDNQCISIPYLLPTGSSIIG